MEEADARIAFGRGWRRGWGDFEAFGIGEAFALGGEDEEMDLGAAMGGWMEAAGAKDVPGAQAVLGVVEAPDFAGEDLFEPGAGAGVAEAEDEGAGEVGMADAVEEGEEEGTSTPAAMGEFVGELEDAVADVARMPGGEGTCEGVGEEAPDPGGPDDGIGDAEEDGDSEVGGVGDAVGPGGGAGGFDSAAEDGEEREAEDDAEKGEHGRVQRPGSGRRMAWGLRMPRSRMSRA